ncbi:MAG: WG repeat-containing protein [Pseudarcicella sp.]|nr:WG repeat-containing protein [Pseudarcicella sp.]MBP6409526.1 WG repeat-containing protein [Pseudarcicella sp.]
MKITSIATYGLLLITSICYAQTESNTDTDNLLSQDRKISETYESPGNARKNIYNLIKAKYEASEKGKNILLDLVEYNNEASLTAEKFTVFISRLEKKYKNDIKSIETDNVRDIFQFDQKSDIKKRLSEVVSAISLTNKTEGKYVKSTDIDGEEIVTFPIENLKKNSRYSFIENYKQGFSRIRKDQVYGFLNVSGDEAIPCQYEKADYFNDGKAVVKKNNWYFVDIYGTQSEALENIADVKALKNGIYMATFKDGKMGLIDNNYDVTKKTISGDFFDNIEQASSSFLKVKRGTTYGLMKIDGAMKIEPKYTSLSLVEAGTSKYVIAEENKKVGILDTEGNIKLKPNYESISNIDLDKSIDSDVSIGIAKEGNNYTLINFKNLQTSKAYSSIGKFNKYGVTFVKDGNNFGVIDTKFKTVIEPIYKSIDNYNDFGLAQACKVALDGQTKCGFINNVGKEVIPTNYESVSAFEKSGLVVVTEAVKNCSIPSGSCKVDLIYNQKGELLVGKTSEVAPIGVQYSLEGSKILNNMYLALQTTVPSKSGEATNELTLLNKNTFKRVSNVSYKIIRKFDENGFFLVNKNDKWGIIDTTGKTIAEPVYKEMLYGSDGLYGVKTANDNFGFIDKKGKLTIQPEYKEVRPFFSGLAIVSKGNEKLGVINKFNAKIAPCAFKEIYIVPTSKQFELWDTTGQSYTLSPSGDCLTNCTKFDEIRLKSNKE